MGWLKNLFSRSEPVLMPDCKRRAKYCAGAAEDAGFPTRIRIIEGRENPHAEAIARWNLVWYVLAIGQGGKVYMDHEVEEGFDVRNSYPLATFEALVFVA